MSDKRQREEESRCDGKSSAWDVRGANVRGKTRERLEGGTRCPGCRSSRSRLEASASKQKSKDADQLHRLVSGNLSNGL